MERRHCLASRNPWKTDSVFFCPGGAKEFIHCGASSAPSGADISRNRFHGLRFAGFAGFALPVATIRRPIRGEKHQANNNGNKVLHSAININHTPFCLLVT